MQLGKFKELVRIETEWDTSASVYTDDNLLGANINNMKKNNPLAA
jgi:hypothetical protein